MNPRKSVMLILLAAALLWFVIANIKWNQEKKLVIKNNSVTVGWIVSYRKVGDNLNRTLKYSYKVNGRLYSRTIAPEIDFPDCAKDINLCADKRFLVIYSNLDHSKSLIDLRHEIDVMREVRRPEGLDDFE